MSPAAALKLDFTVPAHHACDYDHSGRVADVFTVTGGGAGGAGPTQVTLPSIDAAADIQFAISTLAAPEPASWALLILGFGAIGMAIRRRRPALAAG